MNFWEFLLKSTVKVGPVEINGFGVLVFSALAAIFFFRFGWLITQKILGRHTGHQPNPSREKTDIEKS